jgi:hypothetical protein
MEADVPGMPAGNCIDEMFQAAKAIQIPDNGGVACRA